MTEREAIQVVRRRASMKRKKDRKEYLAIQVEGGIHRIFGRIWCQTTTAACNKFSQAKHSVGQRRGEPVKPNTQIPTEYVFIPGP